MSPLDAIILGIVEGITEFLPISSTGHLMLTSEALGLHATEYLKMFEISIQLGAIIAVLFLYGHTLIKNRAMFARILVAFLPTGIIGFALYPVIKNILLENTMVVVYALFFGGIGLIAFEMWYTRFGKKNITDITRISLRHALFIGLFQSCALIPGVSRSAATIIGGLAFGISREAIIEFSFLLALPTMIVATGVEFIHYGNAFTVREVHLLLIGMSVSFIVAVVAMKLLLRFIRTHSFIAFGIYRILIAVICWATLT